LPPFTRRTGVDASDRLETTWQRYTYVMSSGLRSTGTLIKKAGRLEGTEIHDGRPDIQGPTQWTGLRAWIASIACDARRTKL